MFGDDSYFDSIGSYLKFYGLDFADEGIGHNFITFQSNGYTLAGHIFRPSEYKATVFVLHGFLGHCGPLKHLIKYLTEKGYAVGCFDMPGHGLSGGERAGIDDFSQYSDALRDFADLVGRRLNGPYHLIGYSTGGAAALDYLLTSKEDVFDKVILAAPLVRSWLWRLSKIVFWLYQPFGKDIPRVFRKDSSDKNFLRFVKNEDLLQGRTVPIKWVRALYRWNEKIAGLKPCQRSIEIIQGTGDTTVAWRFNIKFIEGKFSDVQISLIDKARHELFNESADIRQEVFSQINSWL